MTPRRLLVALLAFVTSSAAKFHETYKGIATDGVQACINNSNFTQESLTLRRNCREGFKCIMENIPNYGQSIISSGSAILGFIPTVLLVMGNTNAEIVRIHARFPVLAFFLSITNANKRPDREQQGCFVANADAVPLGPYGFVRITKSSTSEGAAHRAKHFGLWAVHVPIGIGAGLVIWQAIDIGKKGLVTWACWTDWYPVLWICGGVMHHLLAVVCMRLSLGICRTATTTTRRTKPETKPATRPATEPATKTTASRSQTATTTSPPSRCPVPKYRSALFAWDLTREGQKVEVTRPKWARWSRAVMDLYNNINYLYGTAIFSSVTMVSGRVAIEKLAYFGVVAVVSRVVATWVLEEMA